MWDLIVSVPDHCLSFYYVNHAKEWYQTFQQSMHSKTHMMTFDPDFDRI